MRTGFSNVQSAEPARFRPIVDRLTSRGDPFFVLGDYATSIECQARGDASHRRGYARIIWNATPTRA